MMSLSSFTRIFILGGCLISGLPFAAVADSASSPLVIAHRGASAYLPEHTLEAFAFAYAQGADYLEQDLVVTRDNHLVVLHDLELCLVTNVGERFPERAREDGRFYVVDFDLQELRQLRVNERVSRESGQQRYPSRFPVGKSRFSVATLEEVIELVQGLNQSTGRDVGIYPEMKASAWHFSEGKDIALLTWEILERYGYNQPDSLCFVQSFEAAPLRRFRNEFNSPLPLIQLIGENDWNLSDEDYDAMRTMEGLREIATYADGIGPHYAQILDFSNWPLRLQRTDLARMANQFGLAVHPYTLRADATPPGMSFARLVRHIFQEGNVQGAFTDHPDLLLRTLNR